MREFITSWITLYHVLCFHYCPDRKSHTKKQNPFYLVFTGMNVTGSGVSTVYAPSWRSCRVLVKSVLAAALRKGTEPRRHVLRTA